MAGSEGLIPDLASAVLDGTPIDWAAAESSADEANRPVLAELRVLATLADLHRRLPLPLEVATLTGIGDCGEKVEHWGHLRVLERVGSGAFGEVDWKPLAALRITGGVRADHSTLTDQTTVDPRLAGAIRLG